jgi:hypothetical protein
MKLLGQSERGAIGANSEGGEGWEGGVVGGGWRGRAEWAGERQSECMLFF